VSRFWFWLPAIGPIRVSTVVAAVALLVVISIKRRNPALGLVTTLAWASTFEILSNAVGTIGFGWAVHDFVWMSAALTGWVVLAGVLGVWPDLRMSLAFAITLAAWVATGYEPNRPGNSNFNILSEILNEASKTLLALAYLLGALRSSRSLKWNDLAKGQPWQSPPRSVDVPQGLASSDSNQSPP
jgi:hypothetical protein